MDRITTENEALEPYELEALIDPSDVVGSLQRLSNLFLNKVVLSTSFGMEDQVITHLVADHQIPVEIFTLDTGRLFPETYSTWSATIDKYNVMIKAFHPNETALQEFVAAKGPNAFYQSVENRQTCCGIRKIEPLKRALKGNKLWITGIRAEHSPNRKDMPQIEWDESNQIYKYHPLLNWSQEEVDSFVKEHQIPVNPLHAQGFVSIGCAPCTRAILPGEDFRAGRWWWEDANKKECGLHIHK